MKFYSPLSFAKLAAAALMAAAALGAQAQTYTVNPPEGSDICKLSSLDLSKVTYFDDNGKNSVAADLSTFGTSLIVRDTLYTTGVGTHAPSVFVVKTNGATEFHAVLGIDDDVLTTKDLTVEGIVDFTVTGYDADLNSTVLKSGTIKRSDESGFHLNVDLSGYSYLKLDLDDGTVAWSDHADVCNAYFKYSGTKPRLVTEDEMNGVETVYIPDAPSGLEHIPLSSLDITKSTCGWGTIKANKSIDGNSLKLGGVIYNSGVGTHGPSKIIVKLNGAVTKFYAVLGLDDEVRQYASTTEAIADYKVYLQAQDGSQQVVDEGTITGKDTTYPEFDIDVNGWKYLILETTNGSDGTNGNDHVDWANAYFVYQEQNSTRPEIIAENEMTADLDCATLVYSQPGVRFMHKVRAASSDATVTVTNLPEGLKWNAERQFVDGIVEETGTYHYTANVTSDGTTNEQEITLIVSDELQLPLPFMGWISWNSVQNEISETIVKQVADLFEENGMYEAGWNTIMMDDWWHADKRASDGKPQPNATRFPSGLTSLAEYVHNKGMKFGLYTDAGTATCAGAFASYGHETVDANQYAEWGIDIVKCDYCNVGTATTAEDAKTRYKALADAFKASGRNIALYVCEWGVREPWKWGAEIGGACWRISYDVRDCWEGILSGVGVLQSIEAMKSLANWQGVNRWNDADMLCTGLHGTGKSSSDLCKVVGMTQPEYRTQFALWCMWSSPMALSFDPRSSSVTEADYAMMKNKELIALNQDRMGQQADLVAQTDDYVIFAKDCENGDIAISLTNLTSKKANITLDFTTLPHLDADTTYTCRDVWANADLDDVKGSLTANVASHGTAVLRLAIKSNATAINQAAGSQNEVKVTPLAGKGIEVKAPGTQGIAKRILVSDAAGRVVASSTLTDETATFSLPSAAYVVNVVCNAKATTQKVIF